MLYPSGFTKGEVIDYYARIAPYALPHLTGRALTFKRFPNGTDTKGFFEKRCPEHRPDWVNVALGPGDRQGGIDYCCLDSPASLVWAANMAAIELHAPMAWADDLERPGAVVFDLDPGPDTDIADCCAIALRVREVLAAVDLEGWCKTSGSKGLQLYVPVNTPGVTHEAAAEFALAVGQVLEKQLPKRGHDRDGQGGATGEDLRRLEPERPPQDDDRPVLDARPARADGVDAGHLGRGRRRAPTASWRWCSRPPTCWRGSPSTATCSNPCSRWSNACRGDPIRPAPAAIMVQ